MLASFFFFFTSSSIDEEFFFFFSCLSFPFGAGFCTAGLADVGAKNRLMSCTHRRVQTVRITELRKRKKQGKKSLLSKLYILTHKVPGSRSYECKTISFFDISVRLCILPSYPIHIFAAQAHDLILQIRKDEFHSQRQLYSFFPQKVEIFYYFNYLPILSVD